MQARDLEIVAKAAASAAGILTRPSDRHPWASMSWATVGRAFVNSELWQRNRRPSVNTNWQPLLLVDVAPEGDGVEVELVQPSGITSTPLGTLEPAAAFGAGFAPLPHAPTLTATAATARTATTRVTSR